MPEVFLFRLKLFYLVLLCLIITSCVTPARNINIPQTNVRIENTSLRIFINDENKLNGWQEIADIYVQQNPDVNIEFLAVPKSDYKTALRVKLDSYEPPSVFMINGGDDLTLFSDKLENVQGHIPQDVFENAAEYVTNKKGVFGIPLTLTGYGFLYNTKIFKQAKINADNFSIFENLSKMIETLNDKINTKTFKKKFPELTHSFGMGDKSKWAEILRIENFIIPFEYETPKKYKAMSRFDFAYKNRFESMFSLISDNAKPEFSSFIDEFSKEKAAIIAADTSFLYDIYTQNDDIELAIAPMVIGSWRQRSILLGCTDFLAINSDLPILEKNVAIEFANWLFATDEGLELLADKLFLNPPYNNISSSVNNSLETPKNAVIKQIYQFYNDEKYIKQFTPTINKDDFTKNLYELITSFYN